MAPRCMCRARRDAGSSLSTRKRANISPFRAFFGALQGLISASRPITFSRIDLLTMVTQLTCPSALLRRGSNRPVHRLTAHTQHPAACAGAMACALRCAPAHLLPRRLSEAGAWVSRLTAHHIQAGADVAGRVPHWLPHNAPRKAGPQKSTERGGGASDEDRCKSRWRRHERGGRRREARASIARWAVGKGPGPCQSELTPVSSDELLLGHGAGLRRDRSGGQEQKSRH